MEKVVSENHSRANLVVFPTWPDTITESVSFDWQGVPNSEPVLTLMYTGNFGVGHVSGDFQEFLKYISKVRGIRLLINSFDLEDSKRIKTVTKGLRNISLESHPPCSF